MKTDIHQTTKFEMINIRFEEHNLKNSPMKTQMNLKIQMRQNFKMWNFESQFQRELSEENSDISHGTGDINLVLHNMEVVVSIN